jgi:hypothetical protein
MFQALDKLPDRGARYGEALGGTVEHIATAVTDAAQRLTMTGVWVPCRVWMDVLYTKQLG